MCLHALFAELQRPACRYWPQLVTHCSIFNLLIEITFELVWDTMSSCWWWPLVLKVPRWGIVREQIHSGINNNDCRMFRPRWAFVNCVQNQFWGAKGAPILFSEIGFCVASCSYININQYQYQSIFKCTVCKAHIYISDSTVVLSM